MHTCCTCPGVGAPAAAPRADSTVGRAEPGGGGGHEGRSSGRKAGDPCLTISHAPPAGFPGNSSRKQPSPMQPCAAAPIQQQRSIPGRRAAQRWRHCGQLCVLEPARQQCPALSYMQFEPAQRRAHNLLAASCGKSAPAWQLARAAPPEAGRPDLPPVNSPAASCDTSLVFRRYRLSQHPSPLRTDSELPPTRLSSGQSSSADPLHLPTPKRHPGLFSSDSLGQRSEQISLDPRRRSNAGCCLKLSSENLIPAIERD